MTSPDATEVTEGTAEALHRLLAADVVRTVLLDGVLSDASADVAERVLARAETFRTALLGQSDTIPVDDELDWTLALSYMELKSQWIQRQVRLCYEEMITGSCNREVALEASMVSALIGLIEPLLDGEHLRRIQELFVAQIAD